MNIPNSHIIVDSEKACKHMPIAVSVACVLVFLLFEIFDISIFYAAIFMLIIGFIASVTLYTMIEKKQEHIVKLDDLEDTVFEENDPIESMLRDIENIIITVNELTAKQIEATRIQTEDAVTAIINRVIRLNEDFTTIVQNHDLKEDTMVENYQHLLSDMLVSFQFQDRTSQIMEHVSNSMEMLNNEIRSIQVLREKDGQPKYDQDEIIKKLTAGFTTAEQHALVETKTPIPPAGSIELF